MAEFDDNELYYTEQGGIRNKDLYKNDDKRKKAETAYAKQLYHQTSNNLNLFRGVQDPSNAEYFGMGKQDIPQLYEYGESRYDEPVPTVNQYLNYEDTRGERQSGWDQLKNGVIKGLVTTGTTATSVLLGLPTGIISAAANGDASKIWDNDVMRAISSVEDWAEKALPNYYTDEQKEAKWYAPSNIFSANFLGDKIIKNFGFTLGAGVGVKAVSMMPKLLSHAVPKLIKGAERANKFGRAANAMESAFIGSVGEGSIEAIHASNEWIDSQYVALDDWELSETQKIQQKYNDLLESYARGIDGLTPSNTDLQIYYNQLQKDAQLDMQRLQAEKQRRKDIIESRRANLGNNVLLANMAVLTLTNLSMYGSILKNTYSSNRAAAGKNIGVHMENLAQAGTVGEETIRRFGKEKVKKVVHDVFTNGLTKSNAAAKFIGSSFMEGTEEMLQAVVSNASKDYNSDYYALAIDPEQTERTASYWASLGNAFWNTLGNVDNWEEFAIGMLSGGMSRVILGGAKQDRAERERVQTLVDKLNEVASKKDFRSAIMALNRHGVTDDMMIDAAIRGDKKDFKDAEFSQLANDVAYFAEAGKIDDLKNILHYTLDNLSDEELNQMGLDMSQKNEQGGETNKFSLMSQDQKREFIKNQKDKYDRVIDMYQEERDAIVEKTGALFNQDEQAELIFYRMKTRDAQERADALAKAASDKIAAYNKSITSNIRGILKGTHLSKADFNELNALRTQFRKAIKDVKIDTDEYNTISEKFRKQIDSATKKLIRKSIAKYEQENNTKLSKSDKDSYKDFVLSAIGQSYLTNRNEQDILSAINRLGSPDEIMASLQDAGNSLFKGDMSDLLTTLAGLSQMSELIKKSDISAGKDLQTDINDAIKLYSDVMTYNAKLIQFMNNPRELEKKNSALRDRHREWQDNKNTKKALDEFENLSDKSFTAFVKYINELNERIRDKVVDAIHEKYPQYDFAQDFKSKYKQWNILLSLVDDDLKQIVLNAGDNTMRNFNDNILSIDSEYYKNINDNQRARLAEAIAKTKNETKIVSVNDKPKAEQKSDNKAKRAEQSVENKSKKAEEPVNIEQVAREAVKSAMAEAAIEEPGIATAAVEDSQMATEAIPESQMATEGVKEESKKAEAPVQVEKVEESEDGTNIIPSDNQLNANSNDNNLSPQTTSTINPPKNSQPKPKEKSKSNVIAMAIPEVDTKVGDNFGKSVLEDPKVFNDFEYKTKVAAIMSTLYSLNAFENVDGGVAKRGAKIRFGFVPALNKVTGGTVLMFIDNKCVGNLSLRNTDDDSNTRLLPKLRDEFGDAFISDSTEPIISNKWTAFVKDNWTGFVFYDDEYRGMNPNDFEDSDKKLGKNDRRPIIGVRTKNNDNGLMTSVGKMTIPAHYMQSTYYGTPVILLPTGSYDKTKSFEEQDEDAFLPVNLKRNKLNALSNDSLHKKELNNLLNKLFSNEKITPTQFNNIIGQLKGLATFDYYDAETKQHKRVYFHIARPVVENGQNVIDENGYFKSVELNKSDEEFAQKRYNYDDIDVIAFDVKVENINSNNSIENSQRFSFIRKAGNLVNGQQLTPEGMQDQRNKFENILNNVLDPFANVDRNRLDDESYVDAVLSDDVVLTNAREMRVIGNSFTIDDIKEDTIASTEVKAEEAKTEQQKVESQENNPSNERKIDNVNNVDLFRLATTENLKEPKIDIQKEVDKICKMLPQLDRNKVFRFVDSLDKINEGGEVALGRFLNGLIILSNESTEGTAYHEAFHLVFHCILDENEKMDLINEYAKKHKGLSHESLEEIMAEDFRMYCITKDTRSISQKIIDAFKRFLEYIHLYNPNKTQFDIIAGNIWRGSYSNRAIKDVSVDRLSSEMQQIKDQAIANGTFMKAPNGNPTNLNERQWLQVRTKAFKEWFGDWEDDAANASKVIDENGEPLVVYHGSLSSNITTFKRGITDSYEESGIYFTSDKKYAQSIIALRQAVTKDKGKKDVYQVFLNIKNIKTLEEPLTHKSVSEERVYDLIDAHESKVAPPDGYIGHDSYKGWQTDNVSWKNIIRKSKGNEYVVFNPNQIKSATDNIGTFSKENDDIRYSLKPVAGLNKYQALEFRELIKTINNKWKNHVELQGLVINTLIVGEDNGFGQIQYHINKGYYNYLAHNDRVNMDRIKDIINRELDNMGWHDAFIIEKGANDTWYISFNKDRSNYTDSGELRIIAEQKLMEEIRQEELENAVRNDILLGRTTMSDEELYAIQSDPFDKNKLCGY